MSFRKTASSDILQITKLSDRYCVQFVVIHAAAFSRLKTAKDMKPGQQRQRS